MPSGRPHVGSSSSVPQPATSTPVRATTSYRGSATIIFEHVLPDDDNGEASLLASLAAVAPAAAVAAAVAQWLEVALGSGAHTCTMRPSASPV